MALLAGRELSIRRRLAVLILGALVTFLIIDTTVIYQNTLESINIAYDRTLLAALQGDGRVPQSELGQRAHLSTAAVNRRLKLLEGAGVIEKFSAQLSPRALGYDLTVIVEVKAENERAHLLDEMQRRFAACPQVQQCYYVTGEWDFVLIFLVRSMDQYVDRKSVV